MPENEGIKKVVRSEKVDPLEGAFLASSNPAPPPPPNPIRYTALANSRHRELANDPERPTTPASDKESEAD